MLKIPNSWTNLTIAVYFQKNCDIRNGGLNGAEFIQHYERILIDFIRKLEQQAYHGVHFGIADKMIVVARLFTLT